MNLVLVTMENHTPTYLVKPIEDSLFPFYPTVYVVYVIKAYIGASELLEVYQIPETSGDNQRYERKNTQRCNNRFYRAVVQHMS